jgi:membrane-bound metal-dependent hydrolase YbcI (DUF457 family)
LDNLTHSLFAATLARTPLGRAGRGTAAVLVLASNAPDIDIVATAGGTLSYLQWHRGPTHGPLGIIGLGIVTAALVWIARLVIDRAPARSPAERPRHDAAFGKLALVGTVGVLCHVLMDLPTSYGTRPLSPFDWHWFAIDLMPIVDIYLLVALTAGLLFGRGSEAARRRNAAIVLAFMMANYGLRAYGHARALALAPSAFGPLLPHPCTVTAAGTTVEPVPVGRGWPIDRWPHNRPTASQPDTEEQQITRCLIEVAALPDFVSPFRWRLVAHTSNSFEIRDVHVLDERLQGPPREGDAPWRLTMHVPNRWTPAVATAASTRVGQVFLGFSRFPAVRTATHDGITTVRWDDMRFTPRPAPRPQNDPRGSFFSATVRIGADGEVLEAGLGP